MCRKAPGADYINSIHAVLLRVVVQFVKPIALGTCVPDNPIIRTL